MPVFCGIFNPGSTLTLDIKQKDSRHLYLTWNCILSKYIFLLRLRLYWELASFSQEIANLVFGSAGSSNVEPFTQLILKPMECGSTLWNQTKL